ncbi:LLM class flavin-dependent oxidoreductase [Saccharopolyspora griseoalba]|uniref:LLM class flavin-dependent oxidoreductase n=1 Tax=Saccharopolyspora griseoalba TaxID=1431848 RepID=A0ABW2LF04_9PSEU
MNTRRVVHPGMKPLLPDPARGSIGRMRDFRFSYNIHGLSDLDSFAATCRRAEELGYDAVYAADHVGIPSPFPILVAAAAATERLRVGTLVLNAPFWSPALLARDIATTDVLTGGRLEIGIGAGHMKWEFEEAGIEWQPFDARVRRMRETIDELGRLPTATRSRPSCARPTAFRRCDPCSATGSVEPVPRSSSAAPASACCGTPPKPPTPSTSPASSRSKGSLPGPSRSPHRPMWTNAFASPASAPARAPRTSSGARSCSW